MKEKKSFIGFCKWILEVHVRGAKGIWKSAGAVIILGAVIASCTIFSVGLAGVFLYFVTATGSDIGWYGLLEQWCWGVISLVGYFSILALLYYFVSD